MPSCFLFSNGQVVLRSPAAVNEIAEGLRELQRPTESKPTEGRAKAPTEPTPAVLCLP